MSSYLCIEKPIFQGGMAVKVSTCNLVSRVSLSGGLGTIGGSGLSPEELREEIRKVKSSIGKLPFAVNLMAVLTEFKELLEVCVEEKVPAVMVGAGFLKDAFKVREHGVKFLSIVSSKRAAVLSERLNADGLVVESGKAGGHLGTKKPLVDILKPILESVNIPVIAAGGVENKEEAAELKKAGVSGIQLGTVFAVSEESNFHKNTKELLLNADEKDLVVFESPAGLPARAVRTPLLDKYLSGLKARPTIQLRCTNCLRSCNKKLCILDALLNAQRGDIENSVVFTGEQIVNITGSRKAKEIVEEFDEAFDGELII